MTTGEKLTRWAIQQVETNYPDDVDLLINHTSLQLNEDVEKTGFSYYIPATNRANRLGRTFLIGEMSYDLFPFSWEQLERMADMRHYNSTCLADISQEQILYARNDAVRQRFLALQARQKANLANPAFMLERAEEWLQTAREAFTDMLLAGSEDPAYLIPMKAGYLCDVLAIAVAFANGSYFSHGQASQLSELEKLAKVPSGFAARYRAVVAAKTSEERIAQSRELLLLTTKFLNSQKQPEKPLPRDYEELASWYEELCYTVRRVSYWCERENAVNVYLWSVMLQNEVDEWGTHFQIPQLDMLGYFDAEDLPAYLRRVELVAKGFADAIAEHGVALASYDTIDEFLAKN